MQLHKGFVTFTTPHDPYLVTVTDCHSLNPCSVISLLAFASTPIRIAILHEQVTSGIEIHVNDF